jgi:aminoglycoside N3'-acetyltransferase
MFKMGIIHIEKQEIWEPPEITKEQREVLNEIVAERRRGYKVITPQKSVVSYGTAAEALTIQTSLKANIASLNSIGNYGRIGRTDSAV